MTRALLGKLSQVATSVPCMGHSDTTGICLGLMGRINCNFPGSVLGAWSHFLEQRGRKIFPPNTKKSYFEHKMYKI